MIPEHLSHSQVNTLSMCGERYRRRYLDGDKIPPGVALVCGSSAHKAIDANMTAKMDTGSPLPIEAVYDAAADAFDERCDNEEVAIDGLYEGMEREAALSQGKDKAVQLAGLHALEVEPEIAPTAVELRIEVAPSDILPVPFLGIIDIIDNGVTIRDTKTATKSPSSATALESEQLTAYEWLYRSEFGKESAGQVLDHLVMTPKRGDLKHVKQETQRTQDDINVFLLRSQAALRMIEAEVFLPAPVDSWQCTPRFCGYYDTCQYAAGRKRATT